MALYDDAKIMFLASAAAGVDNKDFSKALCVKPVEVTGSELLSSSDGDWTLGTGASISNGVITVDGTQTGSINLYQSITDLDNKSAKIAFTISNYSAGTIQGQFFGGNEVTSSVGQNGTFAFTVDIGGSHNGNAGFGVSSTFEGTISNISIKEVTTKAIDFDISRDDNLDATRVGPTGLIEKGRENLLLYSNSFSNAYWTKVSSGAGGGTTVTSGQSGYDGSNNAWLLSKTEQQFGGIDRSISLTGVKTFSVYAKSGTVDYMRLFAADTTYAYFDLDGDGSVGAKSGEIEAKIESVGSGWFRCSVATNGSTSVVKINPAIGNGDLGTDTDDGGTGTGSIYIQDAQLEVGLVATDVITTTSATATAGIKEDEPRFDYPIAGGAPSLLIEPQRQNKFTHSEYMAGTFGVIRSSFTANAGTSPEGVQNATAVFETATGVDGGASLDPVVPSTHGFQKLDIDIDDGTFYSYSFFVKANGRSKFLVQHPTASTLNTSVTVDLSGTPSVTEGRAGATGSQSIVDYGDGWYRVEINGKEGLDDDADGNLNFFFHNGTQTDYLGDVTKGLLFYGFQLEEGKFCSSYIPTHGALATRSADTLPEVTHGITMGTSITVFLEAIVFGVDMQISLLQLRLNDANRLLIFVNQGNATATTHDINIQAKNSDANYVGNTDTTAQTKQKTGLTTGATFKCIARIDGSSNSDNFDLFVNGSKHGIAKDVDAKDIFQKISLIRNGTATNQTAQKTKSVVVWASALTDQQCEDLTDL
jgi:hypothetical protein